MSNNIVYNKYTISIQIMIDDSTVVDSEHYEHDIIDYKNASTVNARQ